MIQKPVPEASVNFISFSYAFFFFLGISDIPADGHKIYFMQVKIFFAFPEHKKEKLFSSEKEKILSYLLQGRMHIGEFV